MDYYSLSQALGLAANIGTAGLATVAAYGSAHMARNTFRKWFPGSQTWRDMCQHIRIQGMQGAGKSTLIENLIAEQYRAGRGVIILDPHGKLAKDCLRLVPKDRMHQVVYHAPAAVPLGMNVLQMVNPRDSQERAVIVDRFVGLLAGLVSSRWGDVQADALDAALWTALANPNTTIDNVIDLITDKGLQARLRLMIRNPVLHTMLSLPPIPFEKLMAEGGIYILDLAELEKKTANFIYALHVLRIQAAAKGRTEHSKGVLLVMDEAQRVANNADEISEMLEELRKNSIAVCLAHHTEAQMSDRLTKFYGLIGTQYLFRLTSDNAKHAEDIIRPIEPAAMTRLPNYRCVQRRQIHGWPETPHIIRTAKPPTPVLSVPETWEIARRSAELYGPPNSKGRSDIPLPSQTKGSDVKPVTSAVLPQLPDGAKTASNPACVRLPEAVQPANGGGIIESLGDGLLLV
jgi:ABC-type ATPase involved in cell division